MIDAARHDRKLKYFECYRNLFDAIAKEILDVHGHDVNQFLESLPDLIFDIAVEQTWISLETKTTGPRVVGGCDIGNRSSGDYWAFRQSDRYAWGRDARPSPTPAPPKKVSLGQHEVAEEFANRFRGYLAGRMKHYRAEALLLTIPQASVTAEELSARVPVPGGTAPPGPQAPCPAEELGDSLNGESLNDDLLSDTPRFAKRAACVFRREGDIWELAFDGKTVHVRHLAGMDLIAELLRHPRSEIDALALRGPDAGAPQRPTENSMVELGLGMSEAAERHLKDWPGAESNFGIPISDKKAIQTAKTELSTLQAELFTTPAADHRSCAELKDQISKLEAYLAQVAGRRGRSRIAGGAAEKARVRVYGAITRAIERITAKHPSLGDHLRASIRTGTTVIYLPDDPPDWLL